LESECGYCEIVFGSSCGQPGEAWVRGEKYGGTIAVCAEGFEHWQNGGLTIDPRTDKMWLPSQESA
jgi:hypothetical protein